MIVEWQCSVRVLRTIDLPKKYTIFLNCDADTKADADLVTHLTLSTGRDVLISFTDIDIAR